MGTLKIARNNSQDGWSFSNRNISLFLTKLGAHMAPVVFFKDSAKPLSPYYISPWQNEGHKSFPEPVLAPLRGDFFCLPFGGNSPEYKGEKHPCHGEAASSAWKLDDFSESGSVSSISLSMKTKIRPGMIRKTLKFVEGENAVYSSHILEGFSGTMPIGHHATLAIPSGESNVSISSSPFVFGMSNPGLFSDPKMGHYQSLALGAKFKELEKVPSLWSEAPYTDCSKFPHQDGFEDLLQIFKKSGKSPAWIAAVFPKSGYLWYALKDASVLPGTVFWMSSRGRHSFPWSGRNQCLALEDTCSFFADGLKASASKNCISDAGFPTAVKLSDRKSFTVNYIQGLAKISPKFGARVKNILFGEGNISILSESGIRLEVPVDPSFLSIKAQ